MGKSGRYAAAVILLATILTAACSGSDEPVESGKVKLLSQYDKSTFNLFYGGDLFEIAHPDYAVDYVNATDYAAPADWEGYVRLLEAEKPDVIAISSIFDYYKLVSAGMLVDMHAMAVRDGYDLDAIHPSVLALLKYPGEPGELYGLSPFFNPPAIYYNKSLFEQYGVPLPQAGMTWEDMLQLAGRFPTEGDDGRPIYGYHHREFIFRQSKAWPCSKERR